MAEQRVGRFSGPRRPGLVVSRRLRESIEITCNDGSQITVTVDELSGSRARIHVAAPQSVRIMRGELMQDPAPETKAG